MARRQLKLEWKELEGVPLGFYADVAELRLIAWCNGLWWVEWRIPRRHSRTMCQGDAGSEKWADLGQAKRAAINAAKTLLDWRERTTERNWRDDASRQAAKGE